MGAREKWGAKARRPSSQSLRLLLARTALASASSVHRLLECLEKAISVVVVVVFFFQGGHINLIF